MAVLGNGGVLEISRAIPEPTVLAPARINTSTTPRTISLSNPGFWGGDRVIIASSIGVPLDINGDGYADCPDGHGFYRGSVWDLGPNRVFYTGPLTDGAPFYSSVDGDDFYNNAANTGLTLQTDAYISRDELDRIRFWETATEAYAVAGQEKPILNVNPGNFLLSFYSSNTEYTSAINTAAASVNSWPLARSEQFLGNTISLPAGFDVVCDETTRNWKIQCDLEEWVLSVDASNLDVTAIGETFGENIKSIVRGAGNLQFQVESSLSESDEAGLSILRLVLLTQNQCNSRARFYIYKNRTGYNQQLDGSVYYECDILMTNTRISTRPTEVITGTADFVATSEIKVRVLPV
jgi:hypothetical protein